MKPTKDIPFHAYANIFPLMEGARFDSFVNNIRERGQIDPIELFEGAILDGRNRYRACQEIGLTPVTQPYKGTREAALEHVLSKNLERRHLNESQLGMVAADFANMRQGQRTDLSPSATLLKVSQAEAAKRMNVSPRTVTDSVKVRAKGSPELVRAVLQGKLPVSSAAKAADLPAATQREIVKAAFAGEANVVRSAIKREGRKARENDLARKQLALPDRKYGVIYADPEWRFEPRSRETGMDRAADQHYPTSETAAIAARDVASIAADDCVLFLWATAPMIEDALLVMKAWGFEYKAQCIWSKLRSGDARGTGYWFTGEHELLLLGTRGNVPAPAPGTQWRSVVTASVGEHSEKPETFHKLIEQYFPTLPKIELNARRARDGWDCWGLDAPETKSMEAV